MHVSKRPIHLYVILASLDILSFVVVTTHLPLVDTGDAV